MFSPLRQDAYRSTVALAVFVALFTPALAEAHKVRVSDSADRDQLTAHGARLIADYGSYQLYETGADLKNLKLHKADVRDDYDLVQLNTGALDTTKAETKALRKAAGKFNGKRMHLVQFAGPVLPDWYAALEKTGVKIVDYVPSNTYLVSGGADSIAQLQAWAASADYVQWEVAYEKHHKIHPDSRKKDANGNPREIGTDLFTIQLHDDPDTNAETLKLIEQLKLAPIFRQTHALNFSNITVKISPDDFDSIAGQPDVVSIHAYFIPRKFCERQDQIVAGNLSGNSPSGPGYLAWLATKGFTQAQFDASGFVVDVTDSGIDNGTTSPNHFGLYTSGTRPGTSRVAYARLEGSANSGSTIQGCDGHGNLNSHIIAGYNALSSTPHVDASGYHYGLGVCPFVKVGSSCIFDPDTYTNPNLPNLISRAYRDGGRVSNNSWGGGTAGAYDSDTQTYDSLVRDAQPTGAAVATAGNQEMVIVFAAGNDGSAAGSVSPPGTGKNLIVVGAGENVQAFGGSDGSGVSDSGANSANDIISFSSRGPCDDGRKKPDICAPGTHVSGGVAQTSNPGTLGTANACFTGGGVSGGTGGSSFFPSGQEFYTASSGTSHSTPGVSGGCALIRQYFINNFGGAPSPAMTKAYLMNSARYMTGTGANDTLPSNSQGMGGMNLGTAFDGVARVRRDQLAADMFTASGQTRSFTGTVVSAATPFRVTLAWTDAPGSTTGAAYKNDLDLTVTVGGSTYKGNVFTGSTSVTGGSADAVDNVESVFLPAGVSGTFIVTVTAADIVGDGVPNTGGALDQDFALVVYNGATTVTPQVTLSVNKAGSGTGTITSSPSGINCGGTCSAGFDTNTTVNLTATPDANSVFTGWSGGASGTVNPIAVTMNVAKTVTANFSALPVILSDTATLTVESCTAANSVIDPDETVTVAFSLKNTGAGNASNVVATLQATGGVTSPSGAQSYGTILAGASVSKSFSFTATGTCGGSLTATLSVQTNAANYGTASFNFSLGSIAPAISENFDGVTKPALPAGWTTTAGGSQSAWITTNTTVDTTPNALFSPDPSTVGSNALLSPVIPIASASAKLTFRNNYSLEAGTGTTAYDGGVLEIKIGSGAFQDILTAGGTFVTNGYTRTISTGFSNPLAGRQAWSGSSGGYITTVVNLPTAASGQNIQLRWRCATDSSTSSTGWRMDTLVISDAVCCTASANTPPVINSASIIPANPATTNNLLAAVSSASDANGDPITFSYQWQESATNLVGQTSSTLPSVMTFAGGEYQCRITPNDGKTNGNPVITDSVYVPLDADANGLNDDWEVANFAHMGVDPNADADGDGFSNVDEQTASTNPNDASALPEILSVAPSGNNCLVIFTSVAGKNYDVQRADDVGGWTTLTNVTANASSTQVTDVGGAAQPHRYYRIRIAP